MNVDDQKILQLLDRWRRATTEGDLDTVLALMADDALFLTPGNPPMTRAEFAAGARRMSGHMRIEPSQDVKEIYVAGDLAYVWSHISVLVTSSESAHKTHRSGHVLTIFRKTPSGEWVLSRDANLMAPSTPQEA
ncbi:MAG: nuclear transport factor 2 family protein [Ardenticatenaceae bacterium]|nr:nuclear transport factor 2 family protein [Ardenticatenaceae bacterium]